MNPLFCQLYEHEPLRPLEENGEYRNGLKKAIPLMLRGVV
jgi:hypothetical protein